jgi:sorting nexin-29
MESLVPVHKKADKTDFSNYWGISLLSTAYKILSNILLSKLSPCIDKNLYISVGFDVADQLLIRSFAFVRYCRKKWEYSEIVYQLFVDFKRAYDSVRRDILYNILIEFGIPMKLVKLIKMCLNETYSKVRIGKHLSDKLQKKMGV